MNGVFLVHKDINLTSHDVVWRIKKKFQVNKAGHTGTLDPLASGLLIVCVGKATKLTFLFDKLCKTYQGTFLFNRKYDTLDVTGKLIDEKNVVIDENLLKTSFKAFHQQTYDQIPPMFSAIKVNGQKMYHLARQNKTIALPLKKVIIHHLEATSPLCHNQISFLTRVSKGTYIRSLAQDIASKMDTYGALSSLQRVAIGSYLLKNAKTLEQLTVNDCIPDTSLFKNYDQIVLNDYLIKLVKNGVYLDKRQRITEKPFIVKDSNNNFIAYYDVLDKNKYYPRYLF
ncbi:tRNA pseudouridine(55) synthase TruB [Candidatus Phytoplasma meliae]|uniref:tRNA pseudouridine synthase B n=1 Tax=Candidatus Phytoplasma meliae TaxID=1848402 RepID=A0ABS5CXI6_9MOLU|nr:tRNA pseudouridine(55) synthase TruB [Candidatus Phytoplasma meliae]MBP5835685.1 tRNA pseudouridine(55) synthase TruB [Candidatus Phytoplasma meliae]